MKKRRIHWLMLIFLTLLMAFLLLPFFARDRALMAMKIYDRYEEHDSVAEALGMKVSFPLEKMHFFPLLMTYNDHEGLSELIKTPVLFTVDYAYGDFVRKKGCSRIYLRDDPLYNAYVGIYSIKDFGGPLHGEELQRVTGYDLLELALPAVGLPRSSGTYEILEERIHEEIMSFAGLSWTVYSSTLLTNGPEHGSRNFYPGDIQFGRSPRVPKDYPLVQMEGRIYHSYLPSRNLNLAVFILAKDEDILLSLEKHLTEELSINFSDEK